MDGAPHSARDGHPPLDRAEPRVHIPRLLSVGRHLVPWRWAGVSRALAGPTTAPDLLGSVWDTSIRHRGPQTRNPHCPDAPQPPWRTPRRVARIAGGHSGRGIPRRFSHLGTPTGPLVAGVRLRLPGRALRTSPPSVLCAGTSPNVTGPGDIRRSP